jgi:hypothetical protein
MGCDIHVHGERRNGGKWQKIALDPPPFDWRSYGLFGFLADVRNYSAVPPIALPRGLPSDASDAVAEASVGLDWHTHSWLSMDELLAFDYEKRMEDRRVTIDGNGGCTAPPGGGAAMTYREFLDTGYFDELARLKDAGVERLVFWFDC